ncbi:MAG TPA: S9 family peptidase, partial [Thermoanaerobaculia bacterium]|nr:S9 family peptidase [Thermoanaerobaculia bacterium]
MTRDLRSQRRFAAALLIGLAGVLLLAAAPKPARRPIAETDLFRFVWVADPQISPDGKRVAFVRVTVDDKREGYETALWLVGSAGDEVPRPLTAGPRDGSPHWSPDGKRLAFTRAVEKDGKPRPPQLFLLSMEGGEARPLTDLPGGVGEPAWSLDGKRIAFTAGATDKEVAKQGGKGEEAAKPRDGREGKGEEEHESDVRIITRSIYRLNGGGYLDNLHLQHLWTVEVPAEGAAPKPPRRVTGGDFDEGGVSWSPDGERLYFQSRRVKEPSYEGPHLDLYSVPASGGEVKKLVDLDGVAADYALSPDGRRLAFAGIVSAHPPRSYDQPHLFLVEVGPAGAGSGLRNLTAGFDADVDDGVGGDQHPPRGGTPATPVWSPDGRSVVVLAADHGRANLVRVEAASGAVSPFTTGDHDVVCFTATPGGSRFALVVSTPTAVGDLFVLDAAAPAGMKRLTRFNDELFSGLDLTAPEEITYKSFDGRTIEAWVQKPPGFDPRKKYPLILDIHGGPHSAYGWTFDHEFQWMAARGYVVLYPNPRGSSSYGQEFGNVIQYHFPGDDYRDLMAGVDELVRRGYVDERHMGVTGGSGGGILTNWVITQTGRFAAAVAQRSIASWADFWYTADFTLFQ